MTVGDDPVMTLTFLGTGTSTGVPAIGCSCAVCRSSDPRDRRLRTSALLRAGGHTLLIDAGPDFRQQMLREKVDMLDALLITHSHYDHVGGIDDLRPFCYPDGFDIYCNSETSAGLRAHLPYCFSDHPYPGAPVLHDHLVEPLRPFEVCGLSVVPLPINHYLIDILGFRIGNLAYITDAKTVPDSTVNAVKGVDTLVVNALRHRSHISHMNLSESLDIIRKVGPRVAYLTHLSHDMGLHAEVETSLPSNVMIAYDGLSIRIPSGDRPELCP